jgi:hypothetical protein
MAGNIHYPSTSLLLPMTGANNSTTFTDVSPTPKTVAAAGNAKIITSLADPFGVSGGVSAFDGSGDYLTIPTNAALNLGNIYTIEGWVYLDSTTQDTFATLIATGQATYVSGCRYLMIGSTRILRLGGNFGSGSVDVVTAAAALSAAAWHHVAVSSDGATVRLFIGGELSSSAASSALFDFSVTETLIGKNGWDGANGEFFGKLSDWSIIKGECKYTANFAPPARLAAYAGQFAGNITESSLITDWRVSAHKSSSGVLLATTTTSGTSYVINCPNFDPHTITLSPKIDYAWSKSKVAALDDYVVPANPDATPHLFKVTSGGTFGASEPAYNTTPGNTTASGTATLTCVGPLVDPKTLGPKIAS